MKKAAQRLLALCVLGASGQAMSQPFTCGGHFWEVTRKLNLPKPLSRTAAGRTVFNGCFPFARGGIEIVLDGNHQTWTKSYKKRWQQRVVTLPQVPADKVVVR